MMNEWGNFGGWGGFGMLFMPLFWVLIILGVAALIRWPLSRGSRDKTPLDILKDRYARGEIDREEYEQKKRDLEK